jgi:alpha-tubulin suppressor-like RCC1 family protein
VSCGSYHTIATSNRGEVFSWGANDFGQCGTGASVSAHNLPQSVNFDQYFKPNIVAVSSGAYHTGFIDIRGKTYMCGKNTSGQLGIGNFAN